MKIACIIALLLPILVACGRGNTIRIGPGAGPLQINDDGVYINSSLLGLPETDITVDTSASNELSVGVSNKSASSVKGGSAF